MIRSPAPFRLLSTKLSHGGPLEISFDSNVTQPGVDDFLNATNIAIQKLRAFGLSDGLFGGPIHLAARRPNEAANGRYEIKNDHSTIFYPQVRGAPDWLWTVVHEIAHRVWHKFLSADAKEVWSTVSNNIGKPIPASAANAIVQLVRKNPERHNLWFFFSKHFGSDLDLFKAWLQTKRISSELPTDYANADPAESFAEVFADTVLGRGRAGISMRRSGPSMKRLMLSLLGPLRMQHVYEDRLIEQQDANFLQSQLDLPFLTPQLSKWTDSNLADSMIEKLGRRPHVTLVYGLDKRDIPRIQEIAKDYGRPIRASLGALNFFDSPDYDVLYIEIISEGLLQLHNELRGLPNTRPSTHPEYRPHLTVAYLKKGTAARFKGSTPIHGVVSRNGFSLIDSSGVETFVPTVDQEQDATPLLLATS